MLNFKKGGGEDEEEEEEKSLHLLKVANTNFH